MNEQKKDIRFNKRAKGYDSFEGKLSKRFYRLLVSQVPLSPGANVLDVGCGTGALLQKMASACPINGYGIDMEEAMLEEAKKKCPEMQLQLSKCESTPFESQTFDVITACMAFHHFSDKKGFAQEAARILKPGGRLYIADPRFPFVLRKALNGTFKLFRLVGAFQTPEEIYEAFRPYGFAPDGVSRDGYAQVVGMKLTKSFADIIL